MSYNETNQDKEKMNPYIHPEVESFDDDDEFVFPTAYDDEEVVVEKTQQSFFQKHKLQIGILIGILCVLVPLFGAYKILDMSGQLFVIGGSGIHKVENTPILNDATVNKINEIYEWMKIYYYEDFDRTDIQNAMLDGLIGGLDDPYSVYYTPEEYKDLMVSTSGIYYGIGAGLRQDVNTMEVTISKVYRGTPAEEAGLKDGDKIISVEGIDATSVEVSALVQHIRGEEGSKVHMVIFRESTGETLEFDVVRRNVELPSVEYEMLEGNIGYIQVLEFQSKTDEQFKEIVEQYKKQGMKGLIIDLRANPGGLLTSVVNMLDYMLPAGRITYIEDKYGNRQEYNSDASCIDMPMVVLIDENSASASEIFAGAMKDYKYATLIGKTTFGKGIVQNIIPLNDGDAIKLTTAKYFTPLGNYIHGTGVAPDVEVNYEYTGPADRDYDKQYDSQFQKGLEELQKLMAE